MEAKTTGVFCNMPETKTKRPLVSSIFVGSNKTLLRMMMAYPRLSQRIWSEINDPSMPF